MNKSVAIVFTVYLFVSGLDFLIFKEFVQSNDAFPYLWIAKLYRSGNFEDAVSGYWSPLLSWISSPFVNQVENPIWIIKILNKIFGLIGLFLGANWIQRFKSEGLLKYFLLFFWIILLTIYSHTETPDFISANLILLLVFYLLKVQKHLTFKNALIAGLVASVCYFAKLYNYIFIQVVIATLLLFFTSKQNSFYLLKWYGVQLLVFISVTFLWISVLHNKYGYWRYEYSLKFNKSIFGPYNCKIEDIEKPMINPIVKKGLMFPLKNQIFINPDEPRIFESIKDWKMLAKQNIKRTLKILFKNLKSIYYDFVLRYLLFPVILIIAIGHYIKTKNDIALPVKLLTLGFIYISGYLLIFYAPRYAYFLHLLSFLIFAQLALGDSTNFKVNKILIIISLVIFTRNIIILFKTDYNRFQNQKKTLEAINFLKEKNITGNTCLIANLSSAKELDEAQFDYSMVNFYLENPNCGTVDYKLVDNEFTEKLNLLKIKFVFIQSTNLISNIKNLGFSKIQPIGINGLILAYN